MALAEHAVNKEGGVAQDSKRRRRHYCKSGAASASLSRKLGSIIPRLPDDLALCILARLPRSLQARRRLICHSWRNAMEPACITSIRKALNISEAWPVFVSIVYKDDEVLFTIVDPVRRSRRDISLPSQFHECYRHFKFSVMSAVGSKVLVAAIAFTSARDESHFELMQGVYSFDVLSMKWQDSMYAPLPTTVTPASHRSSTIAVDMDGNYVYVAGGHERWCESKTIQGAERLDIKTKRWETLPDPNVKRNSAVGVVMGGLFYMIGGYCDPVEVSYGTTHYTSLKSGEVWDPVTREWSLVPELWPGEVFDSRPEGRVVALGDRLYALRRVWVADQMLAEELMYYECDSKTWVSLGLVPIDTTDGQYWSAVHLLKMGEELWVVLWWKWVCVATKPTLSHQPLCWRTLPRTFKRALPVMCGDMVGELRV